MERYDVNFALKAVMGLRQVVAFYAAPHNAGQIPRLHFAVREYMCPTAGRTNRDALRPD